MYEVFGCAGGIMEMVEGDMGRRQAPCMGQSLPIEVVHASHMLYGILMGVAHIRGVDGKAVLLELG